VSKEIDQSEAERSPSREQDSIEHVLAYHRRTKHHLHRFAASPGYLDWATQPNPFRTYAGAKRLDLPLIDDRLDAPFDQVYVPGAVPAVPLSLNSVAMLFELALGLSAWKQYENTRWALRCNPSSGNLHPTEGYAIVAQMPGLDAGVYHYVSRDHCLEGRCVLAKRLAQELAGYLPPGSLLLGLTSIHWREAWKYGERAFRYCQHDVGHAIASIRYAAATLGWRARLMANASDSAISNLLGLPQPDGNSAIDPQDLEHPDALLLISPPQNSERGLPLPIDPRIGGNQAVVSFLQDEDSLGIDIARLRTALAAGHWVGEPNSLSPSHVEWPAIDAVAEATWRAANAPETCGPDFTAARDVLPPLFIRPAAAPPIRASSLIKQRRSAVSLDAMTSISAEEFYIILDRLLPRAGVPPWDVWPWPPRIHCAIFVHRVRDLASGLYFLERSLVVHDLVRAAFRPEFVWKHPEDCPKHLPLFKLVEGDFRETAEAVSCHQGIAGDGAFSLGMIAEFSESIHTCGAWWYRRLFWEAGLLGQVLYLEAEAAGVRGTGIGCYFDDAFHHLLGLTDERFQSLYHFTVGGAVDDSRLTTLPPYSHLERK
jgi:SagB-type dehydrogenase family enzyme